MVSLFPDKERGARFAKRERERTMNSDQLNSFEILDEAPLTDSQKGVYLECVGDANRTAYNCPFEFVFSADRLDARRLAQALDAVFAHYAAFSTRARVQDGEASLILLADGAPKTDFFELTEEEYAEKKASFVRPFDLDMGELARAELVKTERNVYLLFDAHHVVFDGGTLRLLKSALDLAYRGEELPPEQTTLFDASRREFELEKSGANRKSYEYFDNLLGGIDVDSAPIPDKASQGVGKKRELSVDLDVDFEALGKLAVANDVSENVVFLSAFAYALAKFSDQNEALFVSVHDGRRNNVLDRTSGMFVKTFPLYFKIDDSLSVAEFVRRVKKNYKETMNNSDASFVELANRYSVSSDVKYVYQGDLLDPPVVDSFEGEMTELRSDDPFSKLDAQIFRTKSGRTLRLSYRDDLYTDELVGQFASLFIQVVKGMTEVETLGDVVLTTDRDREFVDRFNATEREYDAEKTVVDLFEEAAARNPNALAVAYADRRRTYGEFDRLTKKLASYIASKGVGRDRFVAILTPRDDYAAIATWGVVRSGAAYLPLDPSYPKERLNYMVKDAGVKALVCDRALRDLLDEYDGDVLYTDEIEALPEDPDFRPYVKPDASLVLIYTSGTTGKPKGCVLLNKNVVGFYRNHCEVMQIDANSKVASYASFGFDAGVMDLFTTLMAGAELHIVPDEIRLDLDKVDEFYCVNGITNGFMTTQIGSRFVQETRSTTLKSFLVGGEKLTPFAPPQGIRFVNGYGPTETIGYVCSRVVDDDSPIQPIGKPNGNTKLYVVDKSGRLLPPGACGELCVAGVQVGFGYWRRPTKTMESFVTNPFTDDPVYERMYKTGDVVRLLPSGELDFVGRRDGQVKIRGFRVELAEIEQIVKRFPGVEDATVQAFDDPSGGKFIAAYVVGDEALDVDALNAFIGAEKPSYMIPAVTTFVDAIPLNVNGKVDKRRLPVPVRKLDASRPPETETQQKIFDLVAEVVGTREFGIDVSIYAAGLSSIGSVKLTWLLSRAFDVALQIKDLKDADTVEKLERLILERVGTEETFDVLPDYPLTKSQEGVFIESVARPNSRVYNIPLILKLDPRLDDEKLKNAVAETINAHPFLMTVFFSDKDGNVRQKRDDSLVFSASEVQVVDVDSFDSIYGDLVKPFEILGGRLFRVELIRAQKGSELYLFFDVHHAIADGASVAILVSDFQRAYAGETIERERFTGYEVAALEQRKRQREAYDAAVAFYDKLFEGAEIDCLPKPDADPTQSGKGCKRVVLNESEALAEKTLAFCAKNKLSVNALLCSAFGFTLARYNANDCAVFNTVFNGRSDSRTHDVVSMLVKTLPLVVNVERKTPVGLAREIGKQLTDSMAYDVYSYAELSRNYGVKNDVVFVYQGDDLSFDSFCGSPAKRIDPPTSDEKAPLTFQVFLKGGKFVYELEYDGALFTEKFIATFASAFDKAVSEFLQRSRLSNASILTSDVEAEMDAFNNTEHVYDASKTVVDLFREQAEKRPNDVAVVYNDVKLTYRELDRITDNIAARLVDKGVARDEFVSVLVPRNEFMPIVAMGVLKSGAAYQPLDPTYPKDRIAFMIDDIGAKLLVADRGLIDLASDFRGDVLYTDEIASLPDARPEGVEITPENAFVTIYTSGTTGTPKGSVLDHGAVVCLENYHTRVFEIAEGSRLASCASYGFDASVMDIFAALTTGATMYVVPNDVRVDVLKLEEFFCANKITNAFMTTQLARLFCLNAKCPTLKNLLMGGEKLAPFNPPENVACYNGYGPSETLAYVTLYRIQNDGPHQPVGYPNSNVKLYVVDKYGNRLPFGACGELCISGRQLARGYFQRPEKTAEVFVPNPFSSEPTYERMYRTGDVVRELTDGAYDFVGRRDEQVKVRGFRVELTEIEQIIREFSGVKDATVQALDSPFGGKYIAAYVVSDEEIDVDKLNAFIGASKPPYMIPTVTVQIDSIPTTANGKVDKRKLPKQERIAKKTGLEPEYAVESMFCDIFEQVLGLDKVYADDDFFQIGGTSISAVQVVVKADKAGFPIVFKNVFDNPTPQKLAAFALQGKENDVFAPSGAEKEKYDYSALDYNVPANLDKIRNDGVGDVLLTGAAGFLGSHVLKELMTTTDANVYCVVRSKNNLSAQKRFEMIMTYYFEDWFQDKFYDRVRVVEGELGDANLEDELAQYRFDTILNCAANVKHFARGNELIKDNFGGVEQLVRLAERTGARLVQASSLSVGGESVDGNVPLDFKLTENRLNIGQSLENKYVYSKYLAEQAVIDAISRGKIRGKIIRFGNLAAREKDGEFQVNALTNAFMKQMIGYRKLGCYPVDMMDAEIEFSPIDYAAKAFVLLAGTPDQFTVFHAKNCHSVHYGYFINAMNKLGLPVAVVDAKEFAERFRSSIRESDDLAPLAGLVAYLNRTDDLPTEVTKYTGKASNTELGHTRMRVGSDASFTTKALYRFGFAWPPTSAEYLDKMIKLLAEIEFFETN